MYAWKNKFFTEFIRFFLLAGKAIHFPKDFFCFLKQRTWFVSVVFLRYLCYLQDAISGFGLCYFCDKLDVEMKVFLILISVKDALKKLCNGVEESKETAIHNLSNFMKSEKNSIKQNSSLKSPAFSNISFQITKFSKTGYSITTSTKNSSPIKQATYQNRHKTSVHRSNYWFIAFSMQ